MFCFTAGKPSTAYTRYHWPQCDPAWQRRGLNLDAFASIHWMLLPPFNNVSAAHSCHFSVFGDVIQQCLMTLLLSAGGIFIMCSRAAVTVHSLRISALGLWYVYATTKIEMRTLGLTFNIWTLFSLKVCLPPKSLKFWILVGVKSLNLGREHVLHQEQLTEPDKNLVGRKVSADPSELCVRACRIALSSFKILVSIHDPNLQMPCSRYLAD